MLIGSKISCKIISLENIKLYVINPLQLKAKSESDSKICFALTTTILIFQLRWCMKLRESITHAFWMGSPIEAKWIKIFPVFHELSGGN
jgi:hypothetical protein